MPPPDALELLFTGTALRGMHVGAVGVLVLLRLAEDAQGEGAVGVHEVLEQLPERVEVVFVPEEGLRDLDLDAAGDAVAVDGVGQQRVHQGHGVGVKVGLAQQQLAEVREHHVPVARAELAHELINPSISFLFDCRSGSFRRWGLNSTMRAQQQVRLSVDDGSWWCPAPAVFDVLAGL
eukprot:CAMPEP_0194705308 /NCGR_PEP_ID=MMETSP0295-20121207/28847_1 /TAXON_ID=39354 /ORGANISM="Heterosigma akashiwo, Strain CCMP2393" /LENGTH=177 /DNA_ID=CAMNT_0039600951 /DNA_START=224 /DNA_END=757 /DNA_ORIENTATION=+